MSLESLKPSLSATTSKRKFVEEACVIQKLKCRDPIFLADLFTQLTPSLMGVLASKGIFAESAEEIAHECWDAFFASLDKFEGRSKVRTFVFGILINKIRENRRRTRRIDLVEDSEKVFDHSFTQDGWWVNVPSDPYLVLCNQQLGLAIQDGLSGLPETQKSAFLLIESEGETCSSTCSIMGVSSSSLRVLIFRAKNKLRRSLEGQSQSA